MAVKQKVANWVEMGGRAIIFVPDRARVSCPRCDQELGPKTTIAFGSEEGKLKIGISCECGCELEEGMPNIEWM